MKPAEKRADELGERKHDAERERIERRHGDEQRAAEQARRQRQRLRLGGRDRLGEADLGAGIGLAVLDELVDELADRTFRRGGGSGDPPASASVAVVFVVAVVRARPLFSSRATTKPTTAAPASATPGLLRTKLRVSSISSSGSFSAMVLAAFSIAPAARRA